MGYSARGKKAVQGAILTLLMLAGCAGKESKPADRWIVEELGTRVTFQDIFFLDDQRGWIVGGGINIEGGIVGSTIDGGKSWSFKSGIVQPSRRATTFTLNAVWFVDRSTGFIAGDGFHILRTVDGGEHWHKLPTARRVWAHLADIQFVDRYHGWAIGNGGLARTTDGGDSWEGPLQVDPEAGDTNRTVGTAIHFLDRDRGCLVGRFGLIRITFDGGLSWTRVSGPQSSEEPDLRGLDFADDLHGWAVGNNGTILHTADGGRSWTLQASGIDYHLMDVDFIDASRGWAVGFDRNTGSSVVVRTTDGGMSWTAQTLVQSESMLALFMLDERHGWAVGVQERRSPEDGSQKLLRYEAASQ
jgi:photosystem II stability/assembly factor-like uncharacterized protein